MPVTLFCAYPPCSRSFNVPPSISQITRFCSKQCRLLDEKATSTPARIARRFWPKVQIGTTEECWLWQASLHHNGYGQFQVRENRQLLHDGAHVTCWFLTHGKWPESGMFVCHHCDTPACCNPQHLFLGTHSDNMQDSLQKGRNAAKTQPDRSLAGIRRYNVENKQHPYMAGERNWNSKLTDVQWQEALALYGSGEWTQTQLAQRYGVNQTSISKRLLRHKRPL